MTGPALVVDGLDVSYTWRGESLPVLHDVSLHVERGEAYGLVGESGCGKTTLAMTIVRYLPEVAVIGRGRVLVGGTDVLGLDEGELRRSRGRHVALVSQNPGSALNPSLKVGVQVAEVYRYQAGLSANDALDRATDMFARVQLADAERIRDRYPHELSGGQQQRVMIAAALAAEPELLVLDEPTTGLDATVEAEVLDLVEALRREFSAAILLISHNFGVVGRVCERVGVLYAGRLIEEGPVREVFERPSHPYTRGLLACVPRLGMRKDRLRLDPIPGSLPPLGYQVEGCAFADRCVIARDRCRTEAPVLVSVDDGHQARCYFPGEVSDQAAVEPLASGETGRQPVERLASGETGRQPVERLASGETGRQPVDGAQTSAPVGAALLKIDDVVKSYRTRHGAVEAVAGVSLEVAQGEILGIVGESGSGKTSLAKCIIGMEAPSGGAVGLDGEDRGGRRSWARRVQMIFQNPETALNPRHSVDRVLRRPLRLLLGMRERRAQDARLAELLAAVHLEQHHLQLHPTALSGGLKQRVAIARAFASDPALVLCDEPVSSLDVSVQAAILNLLADLQRQEGVSYVFISHDLAVVHYLADRIAVMYLGELVDIGPVHAVFEPPHHPYTEALLSAIPQAELEGRPRIKLRGPIPSPSEPPSGCRFHTRCPRVLGDLCRTQAPPWQQDTSGNRYRCHIPPAELDAAQRTSEPPAGAVP